MTESCESCRFWKQSQMGVINGDGKCRIRAPQICTDEYGGSVTDFPLTEINEWCGEWQEKKVPPIKFESIEQMKQAMKLVIHNGDKQ